MKRSEMSCVTREHDLADDGWLFPAAGLMLEACRPEAGEPAGARLGGGGGAL